MTEDLIIDGNWRDLNGEEMEEIANAEPKIDENIAFYDSGERIVHPNRFRKRTRTIAERERDLVDIAEMYLKGMSQGQIAVELSKMRPYEIKRTMIWKDIQRIFAQWEKAYVESAHKLKMRELARLDHLEAEYWNGWERSQKDSLEVRRDRIEDKTPGSPDGKTAYERTKTTTRKEQKVGDVRFLEGVERCIKQRCVILGLESPKSVNVNWRKMAEAEGINPDEVVSELQEQFIAAALAGGRRPGSLDEG